MVAVTYDRGELSTERKGGCIKHDGTRKRAFARILDAIFEARLRRASREIARHGRLIAKRLDGERAKYNSNKLPFQRS